MADNTDAVADAIVGVNGTAIALSLSLTLSLTLSQMKKFGRRTVLQLGQGNGEKKNEKPIGLGGLVQYGDDNSDSEEEELPTTPTKLPDSLATEQNGSGQPLSQRQTTDTAPTVAKNGPDMDSKLADFLAEIESISQDEAPTVVVDTTAVANLSPAREEPKHSAACSEEDEKEEEEEEVVADELPPNVQKPVEPTTTWQHCLDESTEHYYYWNTETNEVTWEIPEDYSKYLLQHKEYEELLAKYEATMKEWEERKKNPKKEMKTNGFSGSNTPEREGSMEPKPLVDYEIETPKHKPNVELVTNVYHTGLGFSTAADDVGTTNLVNRRQGVSKYPVSFVKGETVTNKLPELIPKVSSLEPETSAKATKIVERSSPVTVQAVGDKVFSSHVIEKSSNNISNKVREESGSDDDDNNDVDDEERDGSVHSCELPPYRPPTESNKPTTHNGRVKDDSNNTKGDGEMDFEDFDVDDIDRQLELALEKKMDRKIKRKRPNEADAMESEDVVSKKRLVREASPSRLKLTPKPPTSPPAKRVDPLKAIEEDLQLRSEVADAARDITDKLDFLEVSTKGLTSLQCVMVEVETRISDWRDGGLETKFMLKKLREAQKKLEHYEESAAPTGWSCHWDRNYKRYYYFKSATGESAWDYPEEESKDSLSSSHVQGSGQQPAPPVMHPNIQGAAPNRMPLSSQDQSIHFAGLTAAPPPPPPLQPAPEPPAHTSSVYPDAPPSSCATYYNAPIKLPPGVTNPPPPPSGSPPPPPPGTTPPLDTSPPEVDMQDALNETRKDSDVDGNVISAAPQIRHNSELNDGQSIDGVPMVDSADVDFEDLPAHGSTPVTAPPPPAAASSSTLPDLPSVAQTGGKEKKKKKKSEKLGTGLAMKKKGVGNLVQKWQQIQEAVATKQKD